MRFTIQKAKPEHLESLYEIEKKCFTIEAFSKEQIENLLYAPNSISLVAVADGKTVGFIIGLLQGKKGEKIGYIITIDVTPEYRRKRLGDKLLEEVERIFAENTVQSCYLEVRVDNKAALELYTKHGYKEIVRLKDFYHRGIDGIRMKKTFNK